MNLTAAHIAMRPVLARLLLLAIPILLAACNNSGGGSGY
jgi:predicted small secreted protein